MKNLIKYVLLLSVVPISVNAKTVCLQGWNGMNYSYVKLIVGNLGNHAIAPISGLWDVGGLNVPIVGSAVVIQNSWVKYSYSGYVNHSQSVRVLCPVADKNLAGSTCVEYENSALNANYWVVPCKELPDY
jgi:hypothetical protein